MNVKAVDDQSLQIYKTRNKILLIGSIVVAIVSMSFAIISITTRFEFEVLGRIFNWINLPIFMISLYVISKTAIKL